MQNVTSKIDFVIDIQSLRDRGGKYFPKEVAVASLQHNIIGHWIVKAPCEFSEISNDAQTINTYCSTELHGLHWLDGDTTLENLTVKLREITKSAANVYARGHDKEKFLQNLMGRVIINIEPCQTPTFAQLSKLFPKVALCSTHELRLFSDVKNFYALQKVLQLREWFESILLEQWLIDGILKSSECYKQSLITYSRDRKTGRVTFDNRPVGVDEVDEDDDDGGGVTFTFSNPVNLEKDEEETIPRDSSETPLPPYAARTL